MSRRSADIGASTWRPLLRRPERNRCSQLLFSLVFYVANEDPRRATRPRHVPSKPDHPHLVVARVLYHKFREDVCEAMILFVKAAGFCCPIWRDVVDRISVRCPEAWPCSPSANPNRHSSCSNLPRLSAAAPFATTTAGGILAHLQAEGERLGNEGLARTRGGDCS